LGPANWGALVELWLSFGGEMEKFCNGKLALFLSLFSAALPQLSKGEKRSTFTRQQNVKCSQLFASVSIWIVLIDFRLHFRSVCVSRVVPVWGQSAPESHTQATHSLLRAFSTGNSLSPNEGRQAAQPEANLPPSQTTRKIHHKVGQSAAKKHRRTH